MTIFVGINRNRENESMSPLAVIITIVAYFAVLFVVSYWAGHQADNAGFFQGGRQSKWYMVAFAMIGASISGVTYVSVPGMVGASQFGYLQLIMGFMVGQLVIAFVLLSHGGMVLLHIEDAGCVRETLLGVSHFPTADIRSSAPAFRVERGGIGTHRVALYVQRRCEEPNMD